MLLDVYRSNRAYAGKKPRSVACGSLTPNQKEKKKKINRIQWFKWKQWKKKQQESKRENRKDSPLTDLKAVTRVSMGTT